MQVGVIGLGNIGGGVAANLAADGHAVLVLDRDPARSAPLAALGATVTADPAAVARSAEITFLSLPTPSIVDSVAAAWLTGAERGSILVDLSTNAPASIRALGARVGAGGCHLLEAPVTGGAPGAQARKLVFIVGGDAEVYQRVRPLFERLGRASFHMGPLGAGNTAKLVNSLIAFTTTWVSLEGLSLAAAAGIELRTIIDVVRTGGASNFYVDRVVDGLDRRGRPPQFTIELAAKDAALVTDLANELGVPAPIAARIASGLAAATEGGLGARDWSDLVEWIERQSGRRLTLGKDQAG